jgi:D-glycero-D-manno-heptose 1,7-bisphosphate phosphatase
MVHGNGRRILITKELRPAVFIDRDGTLNVEVDYLHRVEDVALIPGAASALAKLNRLGIPVIVVTNQSGIGQGRFTWAEYGAVMAKLDDMLKTDDARIDAAYAAPHSPKGKGQYNHPDHPDRKPNPGMLERAAREHRIDLRRSWMIGDKDVDLQAGRNAGCRVALVRTGYGAEMDPSEADIVAEDLGAAVALILEKWDQEA